MRVHLCHERKAPGGLVGNYAPAIRIPCNKSADRLSLAQDADPGGEHHQRNP